MATANEVKSFKKYLVDSNAFQTLVQTMSLLHKSEPKPKDPMQFIREHMTRTVDADEFQNMKENLGKLNADMELMKASINNITNMITKQFPDQPSIDEIANMNVNTSMSSLGSMDNNVGDTSHISILNDNSLIFDESISGVNDFSETMPTIEINDSIGIDTMDESQGKEDLNGSIEGYTMEIVELDVVNTKSLLDTTIATASQGVKVEAMQIDEVGCETIVINTLETSATDESQDGEVSDTNIKIEYLPIFMRDEDDTEAPLTQGFCGFNSQELTMSEECLQKAEKIEVADTAMEQIFDMAPQILEDHDEPPSEQFDSLKTSTSAAMQSACIAPTKVEPIEDIPTDEEKRLFVMGILDKVVENITELGAEDTTVTGDEQINDGSQTDMSVTKIDDNAPGRVPFPADDAETQLFLAFS